MSNDILNLATNFDWISPTVYILQDFLNRPASRFGIQANVGFDRRDVRRILRGRGVRVWGFIYNVSGDMIMISVPKAQAAWASYVLLEAGVPVITGLRVEGLGVKPDTLNPQPRSRKRGAVSWFLGW